MSRDMMNFCQGICAGILLGMGLQPEGLSAAILMVVLTVAYFMFVRALDRTK